jgi:predicted transcriptional regulator
VTVSAYLKLHDLTGDDLAKLCGIPRSTAYRLAAGGEARGRIIRKVVQGTKGEITANDMLGIGVSLREPDAA